MHFMHLKVHQREKEGITILDLEGRIILGPEDSLLREQILSTLSQGGHDIILNMKKVSEIDNAGIETLVFCTEKFRASGGKLVLAAVNPHHANAAGILELDSLETYPEEQDAVNSFFPERAVPHYDILEVVEELKTHPPSEETVKTGNDETK